MIDRPVACALTAIVLWSSAALIILGLTHLPPLLLAAYANTLCFLLTAGYLAVSGRWREMMGQSNLWSRATFLLALNQIAYIFAFRTAPAVQVDLINYLWPSLLVLVSGGVSGRLSSLLTVALGAGGLALAMSPDSLQMHYLFGYFCAFIAAITWTLYSLFISDKKLPPTFTCLCLGFCAPLCWALHFMLGEATPMPTLAEGLLLALYGGGIFLLGYLLWGIALRDGSTGRIGALSYLIPLLSILFLALFGFAEITPRVGAATILVLLAAMSPSLVAKLSDWFSVADNNAKQIAIKPA